MDVVKNRRYVGLDLAKKTVEVCIVQDGADTVRHSGVKTDAAGRERLAGMLRKEDVVGVETCAYAFFLARFLEKRVGCRVLILNAGSLQVIWKSLQLRSNCRRPTRRMRER
jgi:transposase